MKEISFKNDILPLKDRLFRLALRIIQNKEDAEDIVQDTLIKLWNHRSEWSTIENIETYTLTTCRNLSIDRSEKHERHNLTLDETIHDRADTSPLPDEQLISTQQYKTVRNLIDSLSEKQRSVIQLRDIEGKTYQEIAEVMQISVADVKVNLFRARGKLKDKLSGTGPTAK